jgi:hypothetical protein
MSDISLYDIEVALGRILADENENGTCDAYQINKLYGSVRKANEEKEHKIKVEKLRLEEESIRSRHRVPERTK